MACGCGWFDYGRWNSSWHTCACDLEKPPLEGPPTGGPLPGRPSAPGPSAPGTPVTPGGSVRAPGRPAPGTPGPFSPLVPGPSQPGGGGIRPGTPKTGGGVVTLYRCKETREYCPQSERVKRITRSCEECYTGDPRLKPPPPDCTMTKEGCEQSCKSVEFQCGPITPRAASVEVGGASPALTVSEPLSLPGLNTEGVPWQKGGIGSGSTWLPGANRLASSAKSPVPCSCSNAECCCITRLFVIKPPPKDTYYNPATKRMEKVPNGFVHVPVMIGAECVTMFEEGGDCTFNWLETNKMLFPKPSGYRAWRGGWNAYSDNPDAAKWLDESWKRLSPSQLDQLSRSSANQSRPASGPESRPTTRPAGSRAQRGIVDPVMVPTGQSFLMFVRVMSGCKNEACKACCALLLLQATGKDIAITVAGKCGADCERNPDIGPHGKSMEDDLRTWAGTTPVWTLGSGDNVIFP